MNDASYMVISVKLKDKLSDSGIIGVLVGKNIRSHVCLEECYVSCRVLGRGLDQTIVLGAVQIMLTKFNTTNLHVLFQIGERNIPAQEFVNSYFKNNLNNFSYFSYDESLNYIKREIIVVPKSKGD